MISMFGCGVLYLGKVFIMVNGMVKFFNQSKGFGFIILEEGGVDVFVYIIVVQFFGFLGLEDGQKVIFEIEFDKCGKGLKVVNLQLVD